MWCEAKPLVRLYGGCNAHSSHNKYPSPSFTKVPHKSFSVQIICIFFFLDSQQCQEEYPLEILRTESWSVFETPVTVFETWQKHHYERAILHVHTFKITESLGEFRFFFKTWWCATRSFIVFKAMEDTKMNTNTKTEEPFLQSCSCSFWCPTWPYIVQNCVAYQQLLAQNMNHSPGDSVFRKVWTRSMTHSLLPCFRDSNKVLFLILRFNFLSPNISKGYSFEHCWEPKKEKMKTFAKKKASVVLLWKEDVGLLIIMRWEWALHLEGKYAHENHLMLDMVMGVLFQQELEINDFGFRPKKYSWSPFIHIHLHHPCQGFSLAPHNFWMTNCWDMKGQQILETACLAMATDPSLAERALEVSFVVLLLVCELKIHLKQIWTTELDSQLWSLVILCT